MSMLRLTPFLRSPWLFAAACLSTAVSAHAAVMISQVYGGGGNNGAPYSNDFVELHNSGTSVVSLTGWSVQYSSATGTSWGNQKVNLSGNIPAGGYYLLQLGSGGSAGVALPSAQASATFNMGATAGKLALVNSTTSLPLQTCPASDTSIVDMVGYGTTANCGEPLAAPTTAPVHSATLAVVRKATATSCQDTNSNSADFVTAAPAPRNTATAPEACSAVSGPDPGGEALAKRIFEIQGAGATSPVTGQRVVSEGVVTRVTNSGFFMQDLVGDNDPATSDGIFVFTSASSFAAAVVGNLVEVTGTVVEFAVGTSAQAAARPLTEIASVTGVVQTGNGYSVAPTLVTLPEAVEGDLERVEGMLVTLTGPFTVSQNFFQGRYGQLTLAHGGRLEIPTNRFRPGTLQALALADSNARRRILLDDSSSVQNPNPIPYLGANGTVPRAGDTTGSITGVIDYGLATNFADGISDYKIQPTVVPVFATGNPRTVAPAPVGGNIRVASFNVLNYFTAFTNGAGTSDGCSLGGSVARSNCRGANNAVEFGRQQTKIVKALAAIDADVLGLMEIQNNGNTAAQSLVNALNVEMGAAVYATTALPANTGDDAIRVAMIYKPSRLLPVANSSVSDTNAINNRPTLAQTFSVVGNGQTFSLFVNHFKSKGSCPAAGDADFAGNFDAGDGQGCWNARRVQQAQRLRGFVNERLAATGTTAALIIGDLNAYGQEDPIVELTNNGYADQALRFDASAYSYVFDGAAGRLDHAIANTTLAAQVNRAEKWHVNADEPSVLDYNTEFKAPATTCGAGGTNLCPADPYQATPYRASDHDPVVIGLNLYSQVRMGTAGSDIITANSGDNLFIGGVGADRLTGGPGNNGYLYQSLRDAGDTIVDYKPGLDRIDLSALLASINRSSPTAFSQGVVRLVAAGAHTLLQIDIDGSAGPQLPRTLVTLLNLSPAAIQPKRDIGVQ